MSGIYIHVPFCKKACHYCNFHFSTTMALKRGVVDAICLEIKARADYLPNKILDSIYFGGGTPSLLSREELASIMTVIRDCFTIQSDAEITLEANPDDLNAETLTYFQEAGINRLSIGIQSFFNEDLVWMNRSHSAEEAKNCVLLAKELGFGNLSIDLIYGSPTTTNQMWADTVLEAISLGVPHLSAYCLTVEEKTSLHHFIQEKKQPAPDSVVSSNQFTYLQEALTKAGYIHYEISNFCLPGMKAKHNTSYWSGKAYLGIGPSAHSFDGKSRSWNIANNKKYVDALNAGILPLETEILSSSDMYNEYIMTGLRTMWGVDLNVIRNMGNTYLAYFENEITLPLQQGYVQKEGAIYTLTQRGKFFADGISAGLFYVD